MRLTRLIGEEGTTRRGMSELDPRGRELCLGQGRRKYIGTNRPFRGGGEKINLKGKKLSLRPAKTDGGRRGAGTAVSIKKKTF